MGRTVRDSRLESREARSKLSHRESREPYWRSIHAGLHLGYRRGARGGVWIVRVNHDGAYRKVTIGRADDLRDANGENILSYRQALDRAQRTADEISGPPPPAPYTVAEAIDDYLAWYSTNRKALTQTRGAAEAHILPKLGEYLAADLTTRQLRQWLEGIARSPARARSSARMGRSNLKARQDQRARQATANRVLTILKAALNHAWRDGRVPSDDAWRKVRPFRGVDVAKVRYLTRDECRRLINASEPNSRRLIQAALFTGCRYGELTRLVASDLDLDSGTLLVRQTKSGNPRHVHLNDEGRRFFEAVTAGRAGDDLILTRPNGEAWGAAHQQRPLSKACAAAGITPAITFHILRHTYGTMLARNGAPLQVIAEALGHADTRITHRHYAHLMPSYVADTIRKSLPTLDVPEENVTQLRTR
jgi:integrase